MINTHIETSISIYKYLCIYADAQRFIYVYVYRDKDIGIVTDADANTGVGIGIGIHTGLGIVIDPCQPRGQCFGCWFRSALMMMSAPQRNGAHRESERRFGVLLERTVSAWHAGSWQTSKRPMILAVVAE